LAWTASEFGFSPNGDDALSRENDEEAAVYIGELFEKRTLQFN
jgi:hypothetical protein